ncbi:MAG: hypothetical protein JXA25_13320 [Anaerolineales bacterium]|nr:hypothetical protein [Anaerolineales bacterium]
MPEYYEIRIKGHFEPVWSEWFSGLEVQELEGGDTLLCGILADQAALHGLLNRIRDFNLALVSVSSDRTSAKKTDKGD